MNLPTISTDITNEQFVYSCKCRYFQRPCPMQNATAVSLLIRSVIKFRRLLIMEKQYV